MKKKKMKRAVADPINTEKEFRTTEALKALRTNIIFSMNQREHKRLIFTSAVPMEGKTETAVNFSIILAQTGARVVLIDADMRKPNIHKMFRIKKGCRGLAEVLNENNVQDAVMQTKYENLFLLLAGEHLPPNPAELLGGRYIETMMKILEDNFDYIIIDTPPVNIITDALVLTKCFCSFIMVMREGYSDHKEVKKALKSLELVNADLIGAVLVGSGCMDVSSKNRYGKYHYEYKA